MREAIAAHISVTRAVQCDPHQVIVTSGSQQAFNLLFRVLLDPGDAAWIEEPGYLGVERVDCRRRPLVPVPVDGDGLDVRRRPASWRAPVAVVSPSHQSPLGVTMWRRVGLRC